jgi:hypothetical protein
MRWLRSHVRERVTRGTESEGGATAVIVGLLLTALLGFLAIVVDVGLIYVERSQLQNGADSAAIGVAYSCGTKLDSENCGPSSPTARQLVNGNSLDGLSNTSALAIDKFAGVVHVETEAQEQGRASGSISLTFARALGLEGAAVSAEATAVWGNPVEGATPFPIVFSQCEIRETSALQLVQFRKQGVLSAGCPSGPPGGFGNLDQVGGKCEAFVDISAASSGNSTGNGIPSNCYQLLEEWSKAIDAGQYPIGLFPVYKTVSESGTKAIYNLSGFAAFEVHGWKLKQGGSEKYPELFRADFYTGAKCGKDCIGIIGKFVRHVSLDEDFILGTGGKDMGAYVVRLTD